MSTINKKIFWFAGTLLTLMVAISGVGFANAQTSSFASLNTHPLDRDTVRVMNYTRSGFTNAVWGNSVDAEPGDEIAVAIYYHNSGNAVARDVRVHIVPPVQGASTRFVVNGGVSAANASPANGQAVVNLSAPTTLTYIPGSALWRPDQMTSGSRPFPGGNPDAILSQSGVSIGDIQNDFFENQFAHQGSVVAHFIVGQVATPPPPPPPPPPPVPQCPVVQTISGFATSQNTAQLTGSLSSMGTAQNATLFFEYSTNSNLAGPQRTSDQNRFQPSSFSDTIGGLTADTTYFFRAVSVSPDCRIEGAILNFRTPAAPVVPPVVPPPPTTTTNTNTNTQTQSNNQNVTQTVTINSLPAYTSPIYTPPAYIPPPVYTTPPVVLLPPPPRVIRSTIPPRAVTTICTRVPGQNAAVFNGFVESDITGDDLTAWFEWGPTPALGNRSPRQPIASRYNQNPIDRTILRIPNYGDPYFFGNRNLTYDSHIIPNISSPLGSSNFKAQVNYLADGQIYFFRAVAENSAGTSYGETLACRLEGSDLVIVPQVVNVIQTTAITKPATEITLSTARINGVVSISDARVCLGSRFEWGPSPALGFVTPPRDHGNVMQTATSVALGSLKSGTTYYFRVVAQACDGTIAKGAILSFRTSAPLPLPPAPIGRAVIEKAVANRTAPNGSPASIVANPGDTLEFLITFRNTGDITLTNVKITDALSPYLQYKGGSGSSVSGPLEKQIVTTHIGTLAPGEEKRVSFSVITLLCGPNHKITNVAKLSSNAAWATSNLVSIILNPDQRIAGSEEYKGYGVDLWSGAGVSQGATVAPSMNGQMNGYGYADQNGGQMPSMVIANGPLAFMIQPPQITAGKGETVVLTLRYQNQSNETLRNVTLRSYIPSQTEFVSAEEGTGRIANFDRTTAFMVGDIPPGVMGELRLTMRIRSNATEGAELPLTGTASYIVQNGQTVNADASAIISVAGAIDSTDRATTGTGFVGSAFFPSSILGWLGLILLILVIIFVVRKSL